MSIKRKKFSNSIGLLLVLIITNYSITNIGMTLAKDNNSVIFPPMLNPDASWDLTGTPIYIDDTSANDWTWAVSQAWCSGAGTINNPYRIENVTINGLNSTSCISITNSNKYFVIENCTLYNASKIGSDAGILLNNVENGNLLNNNISNNNGNGLDIGDSLFITLMNNTISSNLVNGISIIRTDYATIYNNTINDSYFGIFAGENEFGNISRNKVYDHRWGINIWLDYNDTIFDNDAYNNEFEGLVLEETEDIDIFHNRFYNNSRMGCWSYYSDENNYTSNNVWNNNQFGMMIIDCEENALHHNNVYNNTKDGIFMVGDVRGDGNYFTNNTIYDNKSNGLTLESMYIDPSSCKYNEIFGNIIYNNSKIGLALYNCTANNVTDNVIFGQTIGVKLNYSNANNFSKNWIYDNMNYGIRIDQPYFVDELNLFYENNFNNPLGINAEDNGQNNFWDNGAIGNFWHDYSGDDADDDGIGDTPHLIPGSASSADNYPIFWDAPLIEIVDPLVSEIHGANSPYYEITIIGGSIHTHWYRLTGQSITTINTTFTQTSGLIDIYRWDDFSDGDVTIEFYVNDSKGNIGAASITIEKDITDPVISINAPSSSMTFSDPPEYDLTITEKNMEDIWYTLNDGTITTEETILLGTTGTIDQSQWDQVGQGTITIIFYANDSASNSQFTSIVVEKDSIEPEITITAPTENEVFGQNPPNYQIAVDEIVDKIWYTINDGQTKTTITTLEGTINTELWESLEAGEITITFYANDSVGNIGSASVNIVKEKSNLPLIISLSIAIPSVVAIGVIITIIVIRSRRVVPSG